TEDTSRIIVVPSVVTLGGADAPVVALSGPNAPSLTAPADSATVTTAKPAFSWATSSGAASYRLQISTGSGFASFLIDTQTTNHSLILGSPLTAGQTTYYWRVLSCTSTGNTPSSCTGTTPDNTRH